MAGQLLGNVSLGIPSATVVALEGAMEVVQLSHAKGESSKYINYKCEQ